MTGLATQRAVRRAPRPDRPGGAASPRPSSPGSPTGASRRRSCRPKGWSAPAPAAAPGARLGRVGHLRRGPRARARPQRQRPHREPRPAGRRGVGGRHDEGHGRRRVRQGPARGARRPDRGPRHQGRLGPQPRPGRERRDAVGRAAGRRPPARSPSCAGAVAALPVSGLSGTLTRPLRAPTPPATSSASPAPRRAPCAPARRSPARRSTADGRPLTFAVLVDRFPRTYGGTQRARAALDRFVAALDQVRLPLRRRRGEAGATWGTSTGSSPRRRAHPRARRAERRPGRGGGEVAAIREAAARRPRPVAETARMQTPGDAPDALVVDRPTWIAVNADSMRAHARPGLRRAHREARPGARPQRPQADRRQGHRRRGRRAPRLHGQQGPRPVRPRARRHPGAAARRPQPHAVEPRARRRPRRLPRSGSACTRRPTACSSPRTRGCATT